MDCRIDILLREQERHFRDELDERLNNPEHYSGVFSSDYPAYWEGMIDGIKAIRPLLVGAYFLSKE